MTAALIFVQQVAGVQFKTLQVMIDAGFAAAVGFFTYMFARGVAEGFIDSGRADRGNVLPSDVTSRPEAPAPVEVFEEVNKTR